MQQETNIIEIIKSRRYFNAALRFLLDKKQRMRLKERGRYTVINPDFEKATKQEDEANEYTDGFYSSDSEASVPDDTGGGQSSQLNEPNQTSLNITRSLFSNNNF